MTTAAAYPFGQAGPVCTAPVSAPAPPRRRWRALLRSLSRPREQRAHTTPGVGPGTGTGIGKGVGIGVGMGNGAPTIDDLYHHRRLQLVRLALLLVDDLPTAEDVVQDAFAALFRRYGERLTGLDDPEAYLRTCVVNAARSVLRRRRTVRAHVPEREGHAPAAEEYVLLHEEHREVLEALRSLTRRQREVLVLRYWSHLTEAQIADALGVSRGTVKSTASRALDALGRKLEIAA
ncbi:SigE family RNA polymerase sigma factor [Streptomyces sp. NPDC059255]|uniref:SigE family RNA polymerase sigma factor n=1 Tax=Streptomyces sp. NPDC059255 TaxID=3346793 RepID=UPI0036AE400C